MDDHYENTIQTWRKLADLYHEKFKDLRFYDASYEAFINQISSQTPSILEIGCGPGTVTLWLKNKLPNAQILATDVSPEMIELAKSNIQNVQFETLDARDLGTIDNAFDALFCGFCIPYLTKQDTNKFVKNASNKLNTGGILYISCIDGDYKKSYIQTGSTGDSVKVHLYQEKDFQSMFLENNIKLTETIRVPYQLSDGSEQIHLIVIGKKPD